jgi:transcriptional regulator with XRE-family HTH domain
MKNNYVEVIIKSRKRLGWTQKTLAEKADVPLSALRRIENGKGDWQDYIKAIDVTLRRALTFLPEIEVQQERPSISSSKIINTDNKVLSPILQKEKSRWAVKYERCIKCGTTDTRHAGRGLCSRCYDKNIESRHKDENRIRKYGGSSSILTAEYLLENYVEKEKSLREIAKESMCSRQYVYKRMKAYKIPLRDSGSARDMALDKGKLKYFIKKDDGERYLVTLRRVKYKEDFFSAWSAEMAYVLGVIYTDGNLISGTWSKRLSKPIGRLTITQKEPELLEKVLGLMECNARILFENKKQYGNIVAGARYTFAIVNNKLYDDLLKFGLTPNKSRTLQFPDVPREYVRHFVRGCWDGDGAVYLERRSERIKASYVSGSKQFIMGMVDALSKDGLQIKTVYTNKRKTPSYYFRLNISQMPAFYKYLYNNVPDTQYLTRKYNLLKLSSERL